LKKSGLYRYGTVFTVDALLTYQKPPQFQTIYISGGRKIKLNKIDIVGFFCREIKEKKI
jgi:hypothetical protein